MKKRLTLMLLAFGATSMAQNEQDIPKSSDIEFDQKIASYAIGYRMGLQAADRKGSDFELNIDEAVKGMREAASLAETTTYTKEQMTEEYGKYQQSN